jgi:hypothetical protein
MVTALIWTHGSSVQVQNPEDEAELTITRWGFGVELSLAPQANPDINKVYPLTFAISTPEYLANEDLNLFGVQLHFDTFWHGKLQSVGSSGEIRRIDVFNGLANVATFTDILEGTTRQEYGLGPSKVVDPVAITLSYRFNPEDRGALLIIGVGAYFRYRPD